MEQVTKVFKMANLGRMDVYLGEPGMANSIQAFELGFSGDKADAVAAFQVPDEDTLLRILAPLWHFQT